MTVWMVIDRKTGVERVDVSQLALVGAVEWSRTLVDDGAKFYRGL